MLSQIPDFCHCRNWLYTICYSGNRSRSACHPQPFSISHMIASRMIRRSWKYGRPVREAAGNSGSSRCHTASRWVAGAGGAGAVRAYQSSTTDSGDSVPLPGTTPPVRPCQQCCHAPLHHTYHGPKYPPSAQLNRMGVPGGL